SEDADPASGQRYYLFTDQRGCPEKVVDDAGDTVWEAYVEPYGTAHVLKGHDFYQPLRFPGHWWDPELGLHYNRFRYYSPWLGRYLQVDPIGEQGAPNVYAYAWRPESRVDVRGLDDCGPTQSASDEGGDEATSGRRAGDRSDAAGPPGSAEPTSAGHRQAHARGYGDPPDGYHWREGPNGPIPVRNRPPNPHPQRHFDGDSRSWRDGANPNPSRRRQHGDSGALRRGLRDQERTRRGDPTFEHPDGHEGHHVIPASVDAEHPLTSEARARGLRGRDRQPGDPVAQPDGVDRPNNGIMLPTEEAPEAARDSLPTHRRGQQRDHPEYSRRVREALNRRQAQLLEEHGSLGRVPDGELEGAVADVENDVRTVLQERGGGRHLDEIDEIDDLYPRLP
ncbi:MAG: RHS repeat-associated core domain-containing protein, partial [Sandaracinaceae bacterium]